MSYKPLIASDIVVEVPKDEYDSLVKESERIAAVERLLAKREYVSIDEIEAILCIGKSDNNVSAN